MRNCCALGGVTWESRKMIRVRAAARNAAFAFFSSLLATSLLSLPGCGSSPGSTTPPPPAPSLITLVVSPQYPIVADNAAPQAFTATGHYSDGSTNDLTASATWTSSNSSVATVSSSGSAAPQALASGQAVAYVSIQAVSGGIKGVSILGVTNHNGSGFPGAITQHNDISRTGQNLNEAILTPALVRSPGAFGKLFAQQVDGYIYAQPLYVQGVTINGAVHNVVYVATEGDSVYAFDADSNSAANANPLWHASLIDTAHGAAVGATTVDSWGTLDCGDLVPQIGITGTPTIDPSTNTMFVEAKSEENGNYVHRLHALDITTGAEKAPGPVVVTASVRGSGDGSTAGQIYFDGLHQMERPGLLLLNGVVYLAYASHCDEYPYHGWLFAYDASTFQMINDYVTTPNGGLGGFWMGGSGIAADSSGNVFIVSGNGDFDTSSTPATELGDSILKLSLNGIGLSMTDYFTPYDQDNLDTGDVDLGSGGILLLPDQPGPFPHLLVEAGKEGTIYLINRDQLTTSNSHYCRNNCTNDPEIVEELQYEIGGLWSMPAYWNSTLYFWGIGDVLTAFSLNNGQMGAVPSSSGSVELTFPSATPSISANGNSGGIVWAIDTTAYTSNGPAVLHAFDASNVANELYNSTMVSGDQAGGSAKFAVPTIANGKVYIGTATELDVYGPLP
jgi:hypothetical protein